MSHLISFFKTQPTRPCEVIYTKAKLAFKKNNILGKYRGKVISKLIFPFLSGNSVGNEVQSSRMSTYY